MVEVKKYEDMLCKEKISWDGIKTDTSLLSVAIELEKNEDGAFVVKAPEICAHILMNYKDVDEKIYAKLVDLVYQNKNVAETLFLFGNEKYSFLHASLGNCSLGLTKEQKEYVVAEARSNRFSHGGREDDLRYQILKNPNWDEEEKRKLVYDFYEDEYDFMLQVDAFERKALRHPAKFQNSNIDPMENSNISPMEIDKLYDYQLSDLTEMYQDSVLAEEIYNEINLCRLLHRVRPITLRKNSRAYKKHN